MAELTYEAAIARLEEIVAKLEKGELGLDDSLKLFEEGTKLASFCNKTLDAAELKISKTEESAEESHE